MFPIFLSCCCYGLFWLCIDSPFFSSTERRTHRPQVEKPTRCVKGRAHPAEEQRGSEVKPAVVAADTKLVSKSIFTGKRLNSRFVNSLQSVKVRVEVFYRDMMGVNGITRCSQQT